MRVIRVGLARPRRLRVYLGERTFSGLEACLKGAKNRHAQLLNHLIERRFMATGREADVVGEGWPSVSQHPMRVRLNDRQGWPIALAPDIESCLPFGDLVASHGQEFDPATFHLAPVVPVLPFGIPITNDDVA